MLLCIVYGPALLDHVLIGAGFDEGALIGNVDGKYVQHCYYSSLIHTIKKGVGIVTKGRKQVVTK